MDREGYIASLIARKHRGDLDEEGHRELERWLDENPGNPEILERTGDHRQQLDKLNVYRLFDSESVGSRLEEELFGRQTIRMSSSRILRFAAVILLPLLVLGGAAWWFLGRPGPELLAEIDTHIHPGQEKAVLVLSDGSMVELDPDVVLQEVEEGDAIISGDERGIRYRSRMRDGRNRPVMYNRLITPRGGSYSLVLADGSRVWLNAGSTLRFPVNFTDSTRRVYLEGEAYFEVEPGNIPFIVSSGDYHTRVLGTSFNVSAYEDDQFIRTTLVEGSVQVGVMDEVSGDLHSALLEPDQQALFHPDEGNLRVEDVVSAGYVSWVYGKMEFHQENLDEVLKRLSRWYDFEYTFENSEARTLQFSARLDRNTPVSEILEMLALTTEVRFQFDGKRIEVY